MKKIMFSDKYSLTHAVLEGRKTMTRRLCKGYKTGKIILAEDVDSCRFYQNENLVEFVIKNGEIIVSVSTYKVGEIVAIAQKYSDIYNEFSWLNLTKGWNNKMFVKAFYMPHQIKITDIKVERLQDISDIDCAKEGVRYFLDYSQDKKARFYIDAIPNYRPGKMITYDCAKDAFADLIDKVSCKGTWESNPFCFCYEFELIK